MTGDVVESFDWGVRIIEHQRPVGYRLGVRGSTPVLQGLFLREIHPTDGAPFESTEWRDLPTIALEDVNRP